MKKLVFILFIFLYKIGFSQIQEKPILFKKIHFVYHQKPSLHIDSLGVYGDSILLNHLELKKYSSTKMPQDSLFTGYFVKMKNINYNDKQKIRDYIYHETHIISGTFDIKTNITTLLYDRNATDDYKQKIKKLIKLDFSKFQFEIVLKHEERKLYIKFPSNNYNNDFKIFNVEWIDKDKNIGKYIEKNHMAELNNIVLFDADLDKHISPTTPFSNCNYGVLATKSVYNTIELISVSYE